MSFWKALADVGLAAAAPFTGGASLAFIPAANGIIDNIGGPAADVGQTAGSIEQGRMKGLIDQAKLQQEQDQLGLNRTNAGVNVGNLDLAQKKAALSAPGALANQSVRGDVLANAQDATVSGLPSYIHVPTQTGGLRPSMLSASSRALGGQMSRNALADSTSGKFTNMPALPTVPTATPLPESNGMDKILQGTAIGGSFLNALKGLKGNGASDPNSGRIAGDITDAQTQIPNNPDTSNLPNAGAGIDPDLLAWWQQQANPTAGGS